MKKKLLLFTMAIVAMLPQGVWGEELRKTIFNLTTVGDGTATVGTFETSGITKTAETAWTLNGTTPYITINLTEALKAGDIIEISGKSSAKSKYFRFYNSTTFGNDYKGAEIGIGTSEGVKEVVVAETATEANTLIGKSTIYMNYSSSDEYGIINYIKIISGSTTTTALSSDKTWSYTGYDAPTSATTYNFVNSNMLYGKGVYMETKNDFVDYSGYLLNLGGNHSAGFDAANGKYLMFKLPANVSGNIVIKHIPYSDSSTKTLTCKVGDAATNISKDNKGKALLTSDPIPFNTIAETPVYIYVSSTHTTYYIHSVVVSFTAPTVSISTIDYATFSSPLDLDFSGCTQKAYIVTGEDKGILTYKQVTKVPAETGILLVGTAGDNVAPTILSSAADDVTDNLLKPTLTATTVGTTEGADYGKVWVLGNKSGAGFYKANDGRSLTVGKAYLYLESGISEAREFFAFNFDNETTSVADVRSKIEDVRSEYFDLQGRKVAQPAKGLYIKNGKKYVIK